MHPRPLRAIRAITLVSASVLCSSALAPFTPALAQYGPPQLDPVVVTATRFPEDRLDAPVGMTVISAEDIAKSTARTLPEILSQQGNIVIRNTTGSPDQQVDLRGFGVTAVDFALECQMDKLAHAIGMDPVEFRILNAYRDGDLKAHGKTTDGAALVECVQAAAQLANWPIGEKYKAASSSKKEV